MIIIMTLGHTSAARRGAERRALATAQHTVPVSATNTNNNNSISTTSIATTSIRHTRMSMFVHFWSEWTKRT